MLVPAQTSGEEALVDAQALVCVSKHTSLQGWFSMLGLSFDLTLECRSRDFVRLDNFNELVMLKGPEDP